jgi:hypothetical protein
MAGKKKRPCAAPKASADPYDPFFPEHGRGESASFREGFQVQNKNPNREQTINPPTYKGLAADYDYYRKEYGIDTPKLTEPFDQGAPEKCTSKELRYDYPLSDADKKQFDAAMKTAIEQPTNATKHVPSEMRKSDMSQVQGYYDEDLEQYLQTKDMKAAPMPSITRNAAQDSMTHTQPYDPESSPYAQALRQFQTPPASAPTPVLAPAPAPRPTDIWSQLSDIFIFVFAGVILIFLCDQLFKLALMIGMKRTMDMIEPYLLKQS